MSDAPPPYRTAFISYAHGDDAWDRTVVLFATKLRVVGGVDADLDAWHLTDHENWTAYGPTAIRESDFVLLAVSAAYKQRWEGTNPPDVGAGAAREAAAVKAIFERDQKEFVRKVKVVLLPGATKSDVPDELYGLAERFPVRRFDRAGLEPLLRSIYGRPRFDKPPLGALPALPASFIAEVEGRPHKGDERRPQPDGNPEPPADTTRADHDAKALSAGVSKRDAALNRLPDDNVFDEARLLRERAVLEASLNALKTAIADGRRRPRPDAIGLLGMLLAGISVLTPLVAGWGPISTAFAILGGVLFLTGISGSRWQDTRWISPALLVIVGAFTFAGAVLGHGLNREDGSAGEDLRARRVDTSTRTVKTTTSDAQRPTPDATRSGLNIGYDNYFDLDAFRSEARPSKRSEFHVNGPQLEFNDGNRAAEDPLARTFLTRVATVEGSDASYKGCDQATDLEVSTPVYVGGLDDDQYFCIKTGQGSWAILRETSGADSSSLDVTLDIALYKRPQGSHR